MKISKRQDQVTSDKIIQNNHGKIPMQNNHDPTPEIHSKDQVTGGVIPIIPH